MTVKELIEELKRMDEDMEVLFSYDYGDRYHTEVAAEISSVEEKDVCHSSYLNMDKVVDPDREYDDERDTREVVILTGW